MTGYRTTFSILQPNDRARFRAVLRMRAAKKVQRIAGGFGEGLVWR